MDGVRGVAIVLVVLSHMWIVAPTSHLTTGAWPMIFGSGNYAVTIFLVATGYLAMQSVLRSPARVQGASRIVRRWLRLSVHVYPLVATIVIVRLFDRTTLSDYPLANTPKSAYHVITYTWTGFLRQNPLEARPDLGHLWYISADLWGYVVLLVVVSIVGIRRIATTLCLALLALLVVVYRIQVSRSDGLFAALVMWQTRLDGILVGALFALIVHYSRSFVRVLERLQGALITILLGLTWLVRDPRTYVGAVELIVALIAAMSIASLTHSVGGPVAHSSQWLTRTIGSRSLRLFGRNSMVIYVWHYPIFWFASGRFESLPWQLTTTIAVALTAGFAYIAQRWIEQPVTAALAHRRRRNGFDSSPTDNVANVQVDTPTVAWPVIDGPGPTKRSAG